MRVWYRSRARIGQLFSSGVSLQVPIARSSPTAELPLEVIEMIIAHLIYDTCSLLACSLTCYSWYIASVPHLHHTLITRNRRPHFDPKRGWPKPLQNASKLGLLPLVKKFQVRRLILNHCYDGFCPEQFDRRTLRQFSALINVQELCIDDLNIPNFMPRIPLLWTLLANTPISLPQKTQRILSPDCILHRAISAPRRSQVSQ